MAKIPKRPDEVFEEITADLRNIFKEDLISIILYGSGARGEYVPGKSDINFLVILTEAGMEKIDLCFDFVRKWKKRNVAIPLFMTKSFIESSLDTFPVEFLNIKNEHLTIFGEDTLKDLEFDRKYVLLQCERELKGKTLNLREEFLNTEGKSERLFELVRRSLTAYVSTFKALLYVKGKAVHKEKKEVIRECAREFETNLDTFLKFAEMIDGRLKISASEIKSMFNGYIREASMMCEIVNKMTIPT